MAEMTTTSRGSTVATASDTTSPTSAEPTLSNIAGGKPPRSDLARADGSGRDSLGSPGALPAVRVAASALGRPESAARIRAHAIAAMARSLADAMQDCEGWSPETRAELLTALDAATRSLTAAKAPVLVAQERSGAWRAPGVRSFGDARSRATRTGKGTAGAEMDDARTLSELDGGTTALAGGELTEDHVRRLRHQVDKLPEDRRTELLHGDGAVQLLDLARENDAPTFSRKVEDLIAAKSARDTQDDRQALRAARYLTVRQSSDGTHISGLLDPVAGYALRLALDAATPVPAADDTRTPAQRAADALSTLAQHALDDGAFKPGAPVRPHITLTMSEETFVRARAHLRAATHEQDPLPGLPGTDPGEDLDPVTRTLLSAPPVVRLEDGPLVAPSELGRILCTSEMTRLVVGADSLPLDVGRAQRLFAGHLRRAVVARDSHCSWNGCTMPARFCEVHHIDWWDDDHGHTSVDRGVLLCDYHHHEIHRRDLDVVREPPDGPPPDGPPRRHVPPGDPDYEPPRYRTVPRTHTRRERSANTQHRLRQTLIERQQGRSRPRQ